ncbi:hypothetical protein PINS_up014785 [Pythium insidiosum]|nr:hypothetical protein PINS_up014785 [Pythium insidiosum]
MMEIGSLHAQALEAADDRDPQHFVAMRESDRRCLQAIGSSPSPPLPPPPPPPAAAARDCDDSEVALVEPYEQYTAKTLRKEVYRRKLKVIRKGPEWNDNKQGYIQMLRMLHSSVGVSHQPMHMRQPVLSTIDPASKHAKEIASVDEERLERASASLRDFRSIPLSESLPDDRPTLDVEDMGRPNEISPSPSSGEASPTTQCCGDADSVMSLDSSSEMEDNSAADAVALDACTETTTTSIKETLLREKLRMLQFQRRIQQQEHWERRLTVAKSKLREIQSELDLLAPADLTVATLLRQELTFYKRERRRALQALIKGGGSDHYSHAALVLP